MPRCFTLKGYNMTREFSVKADFSIPKFLTDCRTAGVKLSRETEGEEVDGCYELSQNILRVYLTLESLEKMAAVTDAVALQ